MSNSIQNLHAYRSCLQHQKLQNALSCNLNQYSAVYTFRIELDCTVQQYKMYFLLWSQLRSTDIPDGLVDVDGEEGAGRVEDGGQVGHQGGQHHRDHDASTHITVFYKIYFLEIRKQVQ